MAHPAWLPPGVVEPDPKPDRGRYHKYRPPLSRAKAWYVAASLLLVVGLAGPFVYVGHLLPLPQIMAAAGVLALAHVALSGLVEGKPWASALDWVRIAGVSVVAAWLCAAAWGLATGLSIAGALAVVSIVGRLALRPARAVLASAE